MRDTRCTCDPRPGRPASVTCNMRLLSRACRAESQTYTVGCDSVRAECVKRRAQRITVGLWTACRIRVHRREDNQRRTAHSRGRKQSATSHSRGRADEPGPAHMPRTALCARMVAAANRQARSSRRSSPRQRAPACGRQHAAGSMQQATRHAPHTVQRAACSIRYTLPTHQGFYAKPTFDTDRRRRESGTSL